MFIADHPIFEPWPGLARAGELVAQLPLFASVVLGSQLIGGGLTPNDVIRFNSQVYVFKSRARFVVRARHGTCYSNTHKSQDCLVYCV